MAGGGRKPRKAAGTEKNSLADLFQLATLVEAPPEGDDWIHETKWDGYRMLAARDGGGVTLSSRSGADWSDRLPEIVESLLAMSARKFLIDGELVVVEAGRSRFQALQKALGEAPGSRSRAGLRFVAFDLLAEGAKDLRNLPLLERKRRLAALLGRVSARSRIQLCAHRRGNGAEHLAQACADGGEGILSKRIDAPYRSERGHDWLKSKCRARQELAIVGYTRSKAAGRQELGALLLASATVPARRGAGRFEYAGRVGTGFDQTTRVGLLRQLEGMERAAPVVALSRAESAGVRWVEPKLVAEVEFGEWTQDGRLRHPVFVGLREDKRANATRREKPAATSPKAPNSKIRDRAGRAAANSVAGVEITHPERLIFPGGAWTKIDLARYFEAVWPFMEPHLRDRPLALVRCPAGAREACFFQKHWNHDLAGVVAVDVAEPGEREPPHVSIRSVEGLVGLAQYGVVELHLWGSRTRTLEKPDRLVLDLDPADDVPWREVVSAARLLRDLLEEMGLESFPLLSGGKGVHVVAPIAPRIDWERFKGLAASISQALAAFDPDRFIARASKRDRAGRIFVDYLRNGRGSTAISPFSPRARAGAPIATPIAWEELARSAPGRWTIDSVLVRLRRAKRDPWADYFELEQKVGKTIPIPAVSVAPRELAKPRRSR